MRKPAYLLALIFAASIATDARSAESAAAQTKPPLVREIFVPEADLDALLEGQPQRVLLGREEYEDLLKKAEKTPPRNAPHKALVISADYTATVEQERAKLVGKLEIEVLEEGLWAVPMNFGGVGIRRASLDGSAAPLARTGGEQLTLFVRGVGRHELLLEMVAPMATTAARQRLTVQLPEAPASRLQLTVPGDVEVKSGADVAERVVDSTAGVTRFELPTASGAIDLNLSLNSRLLRSDRVVVARSVFVDEITEGYERLHATVSMAVLHRAVERFEFGVPDGFEITDVATPRLARWAVADRDGRRVLEVQLREPTTETVLLTLSALRTDTDLAAWQLPRFVPLDVVAESAVVGLLVDQRLIAQSVSAEGLIPINTSVLRQAIPETVFQAAPGAPSIRPVTAWYAPRGRFAVDAAFVKPPAEVAVATNLLLILEDRRQRVQGGFLLTPTAEPLFEIEFIVPPLWHVTGVTSAEDQALSFERYGSVADGGRVKVRLPKGVVPGEEYRVYFEAETVPRGWLGQWDRQQVEFPRFAVGDAGRDVGAIAVDARDDMVAQPDPAATERLSILGKEERARYLQGVVTDLAYRYESPEYRLGLTVQRTTPRLTASTFSFLRVEPDALVAHYELIFDVEEARTRRLSLALPPETPETVSILGLDGVQLKEYVSEETETGRRWDVLLAQPHAGRIRLAVDFSQPLAVEDQKGVVVPVVSAEGVAWQSGHVAVEGDAELEVGVKADRRVRRVDVGELANADYQPGRRLLGVFGFVDTPGAMTIDVVRRESHSLYTAIIRQARLESRLSAQGACQTAATFRLVTRAPLVEVELPSRAELWSGNVNGKPIKPRKEGERLLISLPQTVQGEEATLQLVYEMPVAAIGFRGRIEMEAPKLRFRVDANSKGREVPVADFTWDLYTPTGCVILDSEGTVMREPDQPEPAVWSLTKKVVGVLGGTTWLAGAQAVRSEVAMQSWEAHDDASSAPQAAYGDYDEEMPAVEKELSESLSFRRSLERSPADAPPEPQAQPMPPQSADADPFAVPPQRAALVPQRRGFKSVSTLLIDLEAGPAYEESVVTFTSLGTDPRLVVTLAEAPGMSKLNWGVGLLVLLGGASLTRSRVRSKLGYVLGIILLGSLLPLLGTVFSWASLMLGPGNAAVHAAAALLPYYLAVGLVRWAVQTGRAVLPPRRAVAVASCLALVTLGAACPAQGQEPKDAAPYVVQIVAPLPPVTIPAEAIVVPYDATDRDGVAKADRILVPYAKYVELWDRAYPEDKKSVVAPPAPYALAGVTYQVTLVDDGDLLLDGRMEIDVFVDDAVQVPLGLAGGVFTRADLDGQGARLSVPEMAPVAANAPGQQAVQQREQQVVAMAARPIVLLHVQGKGRHQLDFTVRMRLERRGGWRTVQSQVPSAPAADIEIRVPQAETEVLLQQVRDRSAYETSKPGETIRTALGADGSLDLQWRPRVAEGVVDHSLTAESTALLDVQEDGIRLAWNVALQFRRSEREQFSVRVPGDYLVERVEGTNVRGWEVKKDKTDSRVTVTLLKAAENGEQFTVHLWRAEAVGQDAEVEFKAPAVRIDHAALHKGRLTIRRSPMLDLRTVSVAGASRTDVPKDDGGQASSAEESPLGIQAFQAYRFGNTDYDIRLSAQPVRVKLHANMQSLLKITEYERTLECRVQFTASNRPLYQARVLLPAGFTLEDVTAPGEFDWSVTIEDGRPKLTVLLSQGAEGRVPIVFQGRLAREEEGQDVAIPNVKVLGIPRLTGQMAVQVDPAFDVAARELAGCHTLLLSHVRHWLSAGQQQATAVVLSHTGEDYSGKLRLSYRRPDVSCDTITNIRVTDRSVEETIYLNYRIEHAGVREVVFELPAWMRDARISVPMLRQKTVEPVGEEQDAPLRVRLEVQDEVMGQLAVLIENDRMLQTGVDFTAAIPKMLQGDRYATFTVRQFVALEKAGLDDVQSDDDASVGVERINRRQKDWAYLKSVMGEGITEAFLVAADNEKPSLVFQARRFEARRTTDARINKAETRFGLDAAGAYRAEQLYWIDNKTEQYLEIELPQGAQLWTAQLWTLAAWTERQQGRPAVGEPLKPTTAPDASGLGRIRIPLVKTAEGDLDYVIRLQYAGKMAPLGTYSSFDLPFIRPIDMKVDRSQVRLYVPESHWFDFDDTMTLTENAGDMAAEQEAYLAKNTERISEVLREGNLFAKARAMNSLSVLVDSQITNEDFAPNEKYQAEAFRNAAALEEAHKVKAEVEQSFQQQVVKDNRSVLREQVQQQENYFARNVVQGLGSNFDADRDQARGVTAEKKADAGSFNARWLDKSQLSNQIDVTADDKSGKAEKSSGKGKAGTRISGSRQSTLGRQVAGKDVAGPGVSRKKKPMAAGQTVAPMGSLEAGVPLSETEKQRQSVARYQARHMQQQQLGGRAGYDVQRSASRNESAGRGYGGGMGMGGGGYGAVAGEADRPTPPPLGTPSNRPAAGDELDPFNGHHAVALPTGLASLDVDFPFRGREYKFITPQGDVRVSGRAVARESIVGLRNAVLIVVAALVVLYLIVAGCRGRFNWWLGRTGSTCLLVIGLVAFFVLPLIGVGLLIAGAMVKVNHAVATHATTASPFTTGE